MPDRDLVGWVHNPGVPEAAALVGSLVESLGLGGVSWTAPATDLNMSAETLARTSAIVTAGGDGTILRVAQVAAPHSVPILGINLGRVGFMTELSVEEAATRIPAYLEGSQRVERRMMLQASVVSGAHGGPPTRLTALNDVVVGRSPTAGVADVAMKVDGQRFTTYRVDAVIVATATGSTGYALAAGGPVLHPEAELILVQPLAPHMSFGTGLVVARGAVIELRVGGADGAELSFDTFKEAALGPGDRVVIEVSPHEALFLRAEGASAFYASLTRRLSPDAPRGRVG